MISLATVARILVSHGIASTSAHHAADLATFVAESCSPCGCSRRALMNFLGY